MRDLSMPPNVIRARADSDVGVWVLANGFFLGGEAEVTHFLGE